ncbi:hypothetical protein EWM64_g10640 [Hericium alpestre]|uniref:Uncharacterized protein n=1 Tax=Hericium alpestre TaxID=135208 RepID=A0A4Y9ZFK0_9AGAM|nr:hypothetical protein EWM64_g10640 [Hericium alpestre]
MNIWLSEQSYTLLYRYPLVKSIQMFLNHHLTGGLRPVTSTIFATSLLVFVVTRRWPGARRFFVHDPLSGRRYTLFTSIFSFKSFMGLLLAWWMADNFAGTFVHNSWQKDGRPGSFPEVNPAYHFLAFYISAGLFSGLVSHIVAARILYPAAISRFPVVKYIPRMFRRYPAASGGKPTCIPISGGGAGAVYACVAWEACSFSDSVLTLQEGYPHVWYLSSTAAVTMLIAWNLLGLKRGWGRFNHVANLAGAAFGAIYASYGLRFWDWMRAIHGPGPRTKASSSLSSSPLFRDVKKKND